MNIFVLEGCQHLKKIGGHVIGLKFTCKKLAALIDALIKLGDRARHVSYVRAGFGLWLL